MNAMSRGALPVCLGIQKDAMAAPTGQSPECRGGVSFGPFGVGLDPCHTQSANNGVFANLPAAVNFSQNPGAVVANVVAMAVAGGLAIQPFIP